MGSCTSKLNVNSGTPDANRAPENLHSITNAKEDQNQAVGKTKTFTINREQEESGSSLSLDTRIHTYESVSDEEEEKEKLYELIYNRKWYDAMDFIHNHSGHNIGDYIDMYKRTCLHWAIIKRAPNDVIKSILKLNRDATNMKDYIGKTPIHYAVEYSPDKIVYDLLKVTDKKVTELRDCENMRCLLSEAIVNGRSPHIIDSILQADIKQIDSTDIHEHTPLEIFFRKNLGKMLSIVRTNSIFKSQVNMDDLIEIASILLRAEYATASGKERPGTESILNLAIANQSTPVQFVEVIIKEYPELTEMDQNGNYPIHVASICNDRMLDCYKCDTCGYSDMNSRSFYFHQDGVARILCQECIGDDEKSCYVEILPCELNTSIISSLLKKSKKDALKENVNKELPLHLAISSGRHWYNGVRDLVEANPSALSVLDRSSKLYPFALAASRDVFIPESSSIEQLNTIYELLLRWPLGKRKCISV
jgi:ankyrin repeat protein